MDNKLLNKAITISAREDKLQGGKPVAKIKDEKGLTYTVYKTKQDGSTSIAWEQLQELEMGDTVQIGYVEEIKDSPQYGTVTYRTIRNFNKDIGNGTNNAKGYQTAPRTPKTPYKSNSSFTEPSKGEVFWDKKAYKQCLWGYFLEIRANTENPYLTESDMSVVWDNFRKIERDSEKRFQPVSNEPALPTIQLDEDPTQGEFNPMVNDEPPMDVEGIPF